MGDISDIIKGYRLLEEYELSQSLSNLFEAQKGKYEATEEHTADILREFYYKKLAELYKTLGTTSAYSISYNQPNDDQDGSTLDEPHHSSNINPSFNNENKNTTENMLEELESTTKTLESYYEAINRGVWNNSKLNEAFSATYLDEEKWPKASKLLKEASKGDKYRQCLDLLEARDELCRKIIAVQHCLIISTHTSNVASTQSDRKCVPLEPSGEAREQKTPVEAAVTENRKLLQRIELYKNELMRVYENSGN
ncbi:hypothetical protein BEWA_049610 [Theileria equi strain WA]|uniref:Uncharacterized protein n=1 Tax=Theileria equi strain WA TaxID=1537102 RepID=L1LB46_THEEQ|nr:hypothetical protein BEWA_049610 [Theileria equi strain WA]EKX72494.1 hypothetical protein BEWA_049610 [Theileria equi strain WA]|eukprot:XP_004831946.1 hypothetical protein BEWA_049610 [Theileria equi strain WA]